jgi:YVTN family beta-propeller protein
VANVGSIDVTVVDPTHGRVETTVAAGDRPYGVAFAQGRAFVTNQYENTVTVINLATLDVSAILDVGEYPEGIDATSDDRQIVLANWFDNTVTIIDATTLAVVEDADTCDGPRAFGAFILGGEP